VPDIEKLVGLSITGIDVHKGAEDGTGFVYLDAIGADETPDIDDEIFDYKTSKPFVEAWSDSSAETTKAAGQAVSYGNVRAQHGAQGAQNAAGTVCHPIDFDDKDRRISLRIKVVDADAITKVQQGVYRGVSIKGRLVGKKWKDGKFYRYTVDPVEFSLVDKPANPSATITVVKADGTTEVVPATQETLISKAATLLQEMSLDEVKELIMKAEEIEKAAAIQKMKDARRAHDQNSSCLSGYCGHADVSECAEKVAENHGKILEAFKDTKSTSKSAQADDEAAKAAAAKEAEEAEKKAADKKENDGDADDEEKKKAKKAAEEEEAKKAADAAAAEAAKAAEVDEVKTLKDQIAKLTETVEKMAAGDKAGKRATPIHPSSKVVKKSDEDPDDKDVIAKKAALDKNDPNYVDKVYQIDMAAERELVKL
jgi:hypothetical protein